jgi:hypothetical protein
MELGSNGIQNKGSGGAPSGVAFQQITPSQYTSYLSGDEGWRVQNGIFAYTPPTNPKVYAELDYSSANYDALLIGWASRPVKPNISINMGALKYTAAAVSARAVLTGAPNNWTITDGGII